MNKRILLGGWVGGAALLALLFLFMLPVGARPTAQGADDNEGDANGPKFSPEAASIFNKRCTACHTYGKGVKVGPDLKGVNDRRKVEWLHKFIHASSQVIKSGDPIATQLFADYKQQRMPDWVDLSDKQIDDILEYIKVGGPDIKPVDEHDASTASATDIERGRKLFSGETRIKYGAQACSTCHAVKGVSGGSLGPDLTGSYFRYYDKALTAFLRQPCFQWYTGTSPDIYLTPKESFAIKSFLHNVALQNHMQPNPAAGGSK